MKINDDLSCILTEYKKSKIQSEAEVRSKLIVPLLEYLGYPSWLRAEEFPVYGFEGRKRIPAKNADYILFTEKEFGDYRSFEKDSIEWVQNHSLLVVEAKKPGELEEIQGQSEYYTVWTRAVAYIVSDGVKTEGYYYNPVNADKNILSCMVDELQHYQQDFQQFSYENINTIKSQKINIKLVDFADSEEIISEEKIRFPNEIINYMREIMGRNAVGKDDWEVISLFLDSTNLYLEQNMRYDIPKYMLDIPREIQEAYLHLDGCICAYQTGKLTHSYWNDIDRYVFENEYIEILLEYSDSDLKVFEMGYHVLDKKVSERLQHFDIVRKCLDAKKFAIVINDVNHTVFTCEIGRSRKLWKSRKDTKKMVEYWINELQKLRAIEEYYNLTFDLEWIQGMENLAELYTAVDIVYDGISMNQNCVFRMPGDYSEDDIVIDQPTIFQDTGKIDLPVKWIHGISFVPEKTLFLPGTLHFKNVSKDDIVAVDLCCRYKVGNFGESVEKEDETSKTN